VEECTPFWRRYYWDMEGAFMAPAALEARQAWVESAQVDKSFLATELRAWLALHGPPAEDCSTRWVLKAPLFTCFLRELAAAFPDASFVFTSRDPVQMLPSTCGMAEALAAISMTYEPGLEQLGRSVAARMHTYATAQLDFCARPPPGLAPPLVLKYADAISDPLGTVRRMLGHASRTLSREAEEAMRAHLDVETQHKEGRPSYSLAKFGLDEKELKERFSSYRAQAC